MPLRLTQLEKDRLDVLNSGHGNRFGKGIYTTRPNKVKITVEQIIEVKRCFAAGMRQTTIMNKTGLSEWMTNGVKNGRYDFVVKAQK